tara:strand:+ start:223490 stop:224149 length:660 start_codon:yes stop_codon:yes gene_type:complete
MVELDQRSKNRMVLLLIAGIPVTMILAASWLWYFVARGELDLVGALGTANSGTLVQPPRQLDDVQLLDDAGFEVRYAELEPKWTMLVPVQGARCNAACEEKLYVTRQIHVAMGKEFNRLRRLYVSDVPAGDTALAVTALSDDGAAPVRLDQLLSSEHRGTVALHTQSQNIDNLFPERQTEPSTWYLVDPAGWIMMSYDQSVTYKDVISDLKFLLKNSSE